MQTVHQPRIASFSKWRNPTKSLMHVDVHEGEGAARTTTRYEFPPGETVSVPSQYDRAIHMVDCGRDECHRSPVRGAGYFCLKGHSGVIMGGLAPLLVRVGAEETLLEALDPALQERKAAEADEAANAIMLTRAENAILLARKRANAADEHGDDDEPEAKASQEPTKVAPPKKSPPLA